MQDDPKHIKFQNSQNPKASFDAITLQNIFKKKYSDHSPFKAHLVEFYMIILFEDGQSVHSIDFIDYECKPGTILTVRKDQIHKFHKNDSINGTVLLFTDDFLVSYLEKLEALKSLQLFNEFLGTPQLQLSGTDLKETIELKERLRKEYFNINDDYSLGIIRSELHILIAKLYRLKSSNNKVINNRKYLGEFINFQNLVEKNVTQYTKVKDYAKMLGVSSKTLNNITKNIINKSAKEFIDDVCTTQIKRLLINTVLSVKEIAHASGFEETTNFYKYFKRKTNLTPEQFRLSSK